VPILVGKCKKLLTDKLKNSGDDREFNWVSPKNLVAAGNSIGCRQKIWCRQGIQLGVAKNSGGGREFNWVSPKILGATVGSSGCCQMKQMGISCPDCGYIWFFA
jgi:hypothetical protein